MINGDQPAQWAIIELMGHQKIAGRYIEHGAMHRVDVPDTGPEATPDDFRYTRLYSTAAIYSITFVDEQAARLAAHALDVPAIQIWEVSRELKRLAAPAREGAVLDADTDDNDDEDYIDEFGLDGFGPHG